MLSFALQRLLYLVVVVAAVVVLNFLLIHAAPGDPVETIAGMSGGMPDDLRAALVAQYGLDQSLPTQLGRYLARVFSGDLGNSYFYNLPVRDLILQRLPATLLLVVSALVFAVVVGTALGVLASRNPNGLLSQSITFISVIGYSAPIFWTGIVLIILFASVVPLFPASGMYDITLEPGSLEAALDVAHHLVLPALTLGLVQLAQYSRLARASMLDVLGADYIRTARAKGVAEWRIYYHHALRNSILPIVTAVGMHFGGVLSGAILIETVFDWPGLGRLGFESILRRDYPTILGILFCSAILVVVVNQLTDAVYRLVDPRIKTA